MKKITFQSLGVLLLLIMCSFLNVTKAQSSNLISEVKIINGDGFNTLRQLIDSNFDYTNPNLQQGTFNSVLEFNVAENGKIKDVHASGDCRFVSSEIEKVIQSLLYTVDIEKLNGEPLSTHYKMPVVVNIMND